MTELIRAYPAAAPVLGDLLAKNLDWPGADEIAKRLQALLPPQLQGETDDPQVQAVVQQATQATQQLQAQVMQLTQQLQAVMADKSVEQQKVAIDRFKAETERMKVAHEIQQPAKLPKQPAYEQAS